jgi:hypothetical protein
LLHLSELRDSVLTSYSTSPSNPIPLSRSASSLTFTKLLSFPFPSSPLLTADQEPSTPITTEELIPLVLEVQQYSIVCLLNIDLSAVELARRPAAILESLNGVGSPLEWRNYLDKVGNEGAHFEEAVMKRMDATMTSMFATITRALASTDTTCGMYSAS